VSAPAPLRPDEAPGRERRWLPPLAVLGVILLMTVGARGIADALAEPPGGPVEVGGIVSVQPRAAWTVSSREDRGAFHETLLVRGAAGLSVVGIEEAGETPEVLAERYAQDVLSDRFVQLRIAGDGASAAVRGLPAVRFGYVGITDQGVTLEGVVTAVSAPSGNGAVFDAFAPEGELASVAQDLDAMIAGAEVG
jgi:hypothetical protein